MPHLTISLLQQRCEMKYLNILFVLFVICSGVVYGEENPLCQFETAMSLCFSSDADCGFITEL